MNKELYYDLRRNYENLAIAIIQKATLDYKREKRKLAAAKKRRNKKKIEASQKEIDSVVRFIKGDWYKDLTEVDGDYLISELDKFIKNNKKGIKYYVN